MSEGIGSFVRALPKAELHVHIEGTLEPELMFALAHRNRVELPFATVEDARRAYEFSDLQSFLDIYYQAADVLQTEEDYDELLATYLRRAAADGVTRAEIFFDPQAHLNRGVAFATFMAGFLSAQRKFAGVVDSALILCFLRHLPEEDALRTLDLAEPHLDQILAVGLDSSEVGHPPEKFKNAFARARHMGLRTVAHAGEEGPPEYVWQALDLLGAERIDHGVRSLEDPDLVKRLRDEQTPLTVCPLSNERLQVVPSLDRHPLRRMLELGLNVSINSDDPAYFGGYVGDNYVQVAEALKLSRDELETIARNSLASVLTR
ncbi:MAG TPA: adenosine deaminase [Acidimicrobiia bacterium]|nr:adenosine deaminase [Acidimicrobiia bacterium]